MIVQLLSSLLGLGSLICFIMVVVKMFQNGQTGLGITSIVTLFCCGIGLIIALVVAWQNADRWQIRNIVMIYTVCLVGSIVFTAYIFATVGFPQIPGQMPQ